MKVLLVNPPLDNMVVSTVPDYVNYQLKDSPMPPLGLMYLAAYVKKHTKHEVKICDMVVGDNLWQMLWDYKPEVVGITVTTLTLYDAWQVAKLCKKWNPKVTTVMGGAHCGIYPKETLALEGVDYIIKGEGEIPFTKLLEGQTSHNDIELVENLDDIPFPDRGLIDITKYHSAISKSKLVTSMITSRGCPYNCSFCYQPHYGKRWRARSVENILDEMIDIAKLGISEVEIYDDTFTFDRDRVKGICLQFMILNTVDKVYKLDISKLTWAIRTRVDCVDNEILHLMSKSGCNRINYGLESVTSSVLKTLRKGFTLEQIENAIRWTKDAGIEIQAYFMLGSPGETKDQMLATIDFANKHIPDYAYYSITSPLPGTALYEQGLKEGKYNDYWWGFAKNPRPKFKAIFWANENRDELVNLMEYGFKSFYRRPSYILRQLVKTKTLSELSRKSRMAVRMLR